MTNWQPVPGHILTRWAKDISPEKVWAEYPRPQMQRPKWQTLNGLWDYAITPKAKIKKNQANFIPDDLPFAGEILVPFGIESALSGVKRPLQPDEWLWYRKRFNLPEDWQGQRVLLHFGAVDWECVVWVNGVEVGQHRGGYIPFWFDITDYLSPSPLSPLPAGEETHEIIVRVWDPTDSSWIGRGKQVRKPKNIWYTAVSGIWQTVWLEPVAETHIQRLNLTPDIEAEVLKIEVELDGPAGNYKIMANAWNRKEQIATISGPADQPIRLPVPNPHLWEPGNPFLYDLQIEVFNNGKRIDEVSSYFGMRKFSLEPDKNGKMRLCLNHAPLFQYGPLDQGYWPDGLHTPPSEAAMRSDVEFLKSIDCNMIRKHIKVEPARFYYDCDRLGMIVWQDMPNGGKPVGGLTSFLAILFTKLTRRDTWMRWRAGRGKKAARTDYRRELQEMVDHLHNFTCIGMWVPFNEAWGQFNANQAAEWLKEYDPTRLVDHASGWFDQGGGDCRSIHTYFKALKPETPDENRAVILSEFGGYALKVEDHIWNPKTEFGYKKFKTQRELTDAYLDLLNTQLKPWIKMGLSGAVYTQTSDVEIEINGYLTYDRAVVKMDKEWIAAAHRELIEEK